MWSPSQHQTAVNRCSVPGDLLVKELRGNAAHDVPGQLRAIRGLEKKTFPSNEALDITSDLLSNPSYKIFVASMVVTMLLLLRLLATLSVRDGSVAFSSTSSVSPNGAEDKGLVPGFCAKLFPAPEALTAAWSSCGWTRAGNPRDHSISSSAFWSSKPSRAITVRAETA
jgi:hypothetical protein